MPARIRADFRLRNLCRPPIRWPFKPRRSALVLLFFLMRFDAPALAQWVPLIIAFVIIVVIVLGVSTTKLWFVMTDEQFRSVLIHRRINIVCFCGRHSLGVGVGVFVRTARGCQA
jgi:hypothetical protein